MRKSIVVIILMFVPAITFAQQFVKTKELKQQAFSGETYPSLTFDGTWCWFSDPRAIYHEGSHKRTYAGWVDSYGDITVGYYDHETGQIVTKVLYDGLEVDDHDNPALLFDETGRLMVFFSQHSRRSPIQLIRAETPESIDSWEKPQALALNDTARYSGLSNTYTYQNPVYLADEGRLYLFWRGSDFKPNYATSEDWGKTWSNGKILILPERIYKDRRPYLKVSSNGKNRIHFAFTDGHPRNEKTNSIYHFYYQDGKLLKTDGTEIQSLSAGPVDPAKTTRVYDATQSGSKAWIWDVTSDADEKPVLTFAKFPNDTTHIYAYAWWDGKSWQNADLVDSGSWFPDTPEGKTEREPNYSGGIVLDHENPEICYLSVNRDSIFEIEQWQRPARGSRWERKMITQGSVKDNIRPFAVRNAAPGNPLQVLWLAKTKYVHYTDYQTALQMGLPPKPNSNSLDSASIVNLMQKVADWQLTNPYIRDDRMDWHWGAFYTGLMALYQTTGESRYLNEIRNLGQDRNWKLLNDIYHADRHTIVQPMVELYQIDQNPEIIEKMQWALDMHVSRKPKADVRFKENPYRLEWWTWCDALYMAPPSFARMYEATGEEKYLKYLDEHWWKTSDYLYSTADSLYFRDDRFFEDRTENGKKVFWGRGNGWVIAGLARLIPYMPEEMDSYDKYVHQFREMAYKLKSLQRDHGLWTASLLDPEQLPTGESSGSAFFTFALTWGINQGLLPEAEFKPVVIKAWQSLVKNVSPEGRLGYVQQVAGSPYPFYENQWHVYASGAFLLAGEEMVKMSR